jgi:hypothetical protein
MAAGRQRSSRVRSPLAVGLWRQWQRACAGPRRQWRGVQRCTGVDCGMQSGAGGKEQRAVAAYMARLLVLWRAHARLVLQIKFGTKSSAYSAGKQACRSAISFHQDRRPTNHPCMHHALSLSLSGEQPISLWPCLVTWFGGGRICTVSPPNTVAFLFLVQKIVQKMIN